MVPHRLTPVIALALFVCTVGVLRAEPQLHKGTVVSAKGKSLVIKDMAGKDQTFTVDESTKITVNGKPGKLEELQETMPVQVTTDEKGKTLAVSTVDKDKARPRSRVLVALDTHG